LACARRKLGLARFWDAMSL